MKHDFINLKKYLILIMLWEGKEVAKEGTPP